jgi:hypothetical protein
VRPWVLVIALGFAFSPLLVDWIGHGVEDPADAYVAVFVALLALLVRRGSEAGPEPSLTAAAPWLLAAGMIQLVCWSGGVPRLARVALPLAVIGTLRATTRLPLRQTSLAVFLVAPPHALNGSPLRIDLAQELRGLIAVVLPAARTVAVEAWDNGLRLAALVAGLSWFHTATDGLGWAPSIRRMLGWAVLAIGLQALAIVIATGLTVAAGHAVATAWLTHGVWISVVAVFGAASLRARPSRVVSRAR